MHRTPDLGGRVWMDVEGRGERQLGIQGSVGLSMGTG